jgi:hypothetical protein
MASIYETVAVRAIAWNPAEPRRANHSVRALPTKEESE